VADKKLCCERIDVDTAFASVDSGSEQTMFEYTEAYRIWRYALNPMYHYWKVQLDTSEYAIMKTFVDSFTGLTYGDIVDAECPVADEEKLRRLIAGALFRLKELGAVKATTWAMPGTVLRKLVETLGFKKSGHETYFSVKVTQPEYEYLYDFSTWDLKQADATNF